MSSSLLAPFRVRSYRFQWPADQLISWAFEMETLILGWYVLVETGSVVMLTIYASLLYVGTLIAPLLGVVSDRIGHRITLASMRAVYAIVAATVMILAFTGHLNPFVVFILAAVMGTVRPSDLGLRGALIAESVPAVHLTAAMSISRTTSDTARILGALVGAGVAATYGVGPAYVVVTALYATGALLTRLAVAPKIEGAGVPPVAEPVISTSPWRDLREGVVHIWNTPALLAMIWYAFLFNLTTFPLTQGLLPYVAKDVYQVDQTGLGYLVASISLGAMAGAILLGWFRMPLPLSRIMIVSAVVWHLLLMVFAQMHTMTGGLVMLLVVGFVQSLTMVSHAVILLRVAGPRFRGRALGVRMMAIYSLPLGLMAAGGLIGWVGYHATATLYAAFGLVMTIVAAVYWRAYLWRVQPQDASLS